MFDAGFLEMLMVGIVALLVIGPERLPGVAAKIGRFVAKARRFIATTRSDIEREFQTEELRNLLNKQEDEIRELRHLMKSSADKLQREVRETESLVDNTTRQTVAAVKSPSSVPDEKS